MESNIPYKCSGRDPKHYKMSCEIAAVNNEWLMSKLQTDAETQGFSFNVHYGAKLEQQIMFRLMFCV